MSTWPTLAEQNEYLAGRRDAKDGKLPRKECTDFYSRGYTAYVDKGSKYVQSGKNERKVH